MNLIYEYTKNHILILNTLSKDLWLLGIMVLDVGLEIKGSKYGLLDLCFSFKKKIKVKVFIYR